MKKILFSLFSLAIGICSNAQETVSGIGNIEFISNELSKIIKADAKVEVLAKGFEFTEGPVWIDKQKMLLFSDIPANTIYKWTEQNGKEVYVKPSGYTGAEARGGFLGSNGLALSNDGKLLICQHGDRRIAMMDAPLTAPQSHFVTVAADYQEKRLNSPNDLMVTPGGDIYFTDPSYGFENGSADPKKALSFQGLYKINKNGELRLLIDSIEQPNGIGMMPGGKTLLVSNSDEKKNGWYVYDIAPDGSLKNGRIFYDVSHAKESGGCDGLKIDKAGNVFATGPGGIWIFTKEGKLMGKIKMDKIVAANCALTPDDKTLYITASNYLLRVKMR